MNGKLILVSGSKQQREITIPDGGLLFGRACDVDVLVNHKSVSRRHCLVWSELGQYMVRDLGSTNGTYVNDEAVSCSILNDGDELQIGPVVFLQCGEDAHRGPVQQGWLEDELLDEHASVLTAAEAHAG